MYNVGKVITNSIIETKYDKFKLIKNKYRVQESEDEIYLKFHILIYLLRDCSYRKIGYYLASMKQLREETQEHIQLASFILQGMICF